MNQGDIFLTDFDPSVGHEYKKERPAVIISSKKINSSHSLITVMPITSNGGSKITDDIEIRKDTENNLYKNSVIKVRNICSFDPVRFKVLIGSIDVNTLAQIKTYIKKHFDL